MGGAASKAARSLPKTASSSAVTASGIPSAATASASRPVQGLGSRGQNPRPTFDSSGLTRAETEPSALEGAAKMGPQVGPRVGRREGGREVKDDLIRRDAFDPDFVSQLNLLGPVAVDHPSLSGSSSSASRSAASLHQPQSIASGVSDQAATGTPRNRGESPMMRILRARQEREDSMLQALDEQEEAGSVGEHRNISAVSPPLSTRTLDAPTLSMLLDELKSAKSSADVATLSHSYDFDAATLAILTRRFNSPSIGGKVDSEQDDLRWNEERDSDRPTRMYAIWRQTSVDIGGVASSK